MEDWWSRDEFDLRTIINIVSALGTAISALVTGVLAFLTYSTLLEVQQQRKLMDAQRQLMFDQVRLANESDIKISTPTSKDFKDSMDLSLSIKNNGGPATNVNLKFVIICCPLFGELLDKPEIDKFSNLVNEGMHRISRGETSIWPMYISQMML